MSTTLQFPKVLTSRELSKLAAPDETHEVLVVILGLTTAGPYTLRGRRRQYLAERDHKMNAHILRVPLSVWMHGFPDGPWRDNNSICCDLQTYRTGLKRPLTFPVRQIRPTAAPKPIAALRELAGAMGAPELLLEAIDLLASDKPAQEIERGLLDTMAEITGDPPAPDPEAAAKAAEKNRERQRRYRERKAAEKAAAKK